MPLDVRGRTRATLEGPAGPASSAGRSGQSAEPPPCLGQGVAILSLERGIPSRRESSARVDYVPALCTHRPSLLPIERFSEVLGLFGSRITLTAWREDDQTVAFRGSKSRNKVSVGEPAEGSLSVASLH